MQENSCYHAPGFDDRLAAFYDKKKRKEGMENLKDKRFTDRQRTVRSIIAFMLVVFFIIGALIIKNNLVKNGIKEIQYEKFIQMADAGDIKSIKWDEDAETIKAYDKKGKEYKTANPKYETVFMMIFQLFIYAAFFAILIKGTGIGSSLKKDKEPDVTTNVKFKDVAGLEEVKEDLMTATVLW